MHYFYPDRMVDEGNSTGAEQIQAHAAARVGECLTQIDNQFAASGDPWLLGDRYSAVDIYSFMVCRWTRGFATRPAREYPLIGSFLQRMLARPAAQQTFAAEKRPEPWV
jgi:glutathione S-transferase